jgi:hypothetical protein
MLMFCLGHYLGTATPHWRVWKIPAGSQWGSNSANVPSLSGNIINLHKTVNCPLSNHLLSYRLVPVYIRMINRMTMHSCLLARSQGTLNNKLATLLPRPVSHLPQTALNKIYCMF